LASLHPAACVCNAGYAGENSSSCAPCERGKFKEFVGPGICVDLSIQQRIVVMLTVNVPISLQEYTENFRIVFTNVIAIVAGVKASDVRIVNVKSTPIRRRLLSGSIFIEIKVLAKDSESAARIARQLDAESINRQIQKMGLPQVTIIIGATIHMPTSGVKGATIHVPTSGEIPTGPESFDPESPDSESSETNVSNPSTRKNILELWHFVLICVVCCFSVVFITLAIKRCHRRAKTTPVSPSMDLATGACSDPASLVRSSGYPVLGQSGNVEPIESNVSNSADLSSAVAFSVDCEECNPSSDTAAFNLKPQLDVGTIALPSFSVSLFLPTLKCTNVGRVTSDEIEELKAPASQTPSDWDPKQTSDDLNGLRAPVSQIKSKWERKQADASQVAIKVAAGSDEIDIQEELSASDVPNQDESAENVLLVEPECATANNNHVKSSFEFLNENECLPFPVSSPAALMRFRFSKDNFDGTAEQKLVRRQKSESEEEEVRIC